jgi:beta-carotene/zeaxanthin 4-ketolase
LKTCDRSLCYAVEIEQFINQKDNYYGLLIALLIICLWAVNLTFLLDLDFSKIPIWAIAIAIVWQMFLYTGLFITAHDAMHGVIYRQNKKINHLIGSLAVWLYGFFSYQQLLKNHWLHHHHPASELDPDFHDGKHKNGINWYFHFMKRYWSWNQFIGMTIAFSLSSYVFHISQINFILFLIIPLILSSIQLFYFGTYLPHREPETGYIRPHSAQSLSLPLFWSFIACYHFGYHLEHHQYPHIPWWQLPKVYQAEIGNS